jgi:hypothetical protein
MIIECRWCESRIGVKYPCDNPNITNGICKPCFVDAIVEAAND